MSLLIIPSWGGRKRRGRRPSRGQVRSSQTRPLTTVNDPRERGAENPKVGLESTPESSGAPGAYLEIGHPPRDLVAVCSQTMNRRLHTRVVEADGLGSGALATADAVADQAQRADAGDGQARGLGNRRQG